MNARRKKQLSALVGRRWDPRRGVGGVLGNTRFGLIVAFGVLLVFGGFIPLVPGVPEPTITLTYAPLLGLIACWLLPITIRRRTKERVGRHGGFLCPWCRYGLSGLPDRGVCPECGSGYRADICRVLYDSAYRGYQPDPVVLKRREKWAWARALRERSRAGSAGKSESR